MPSQRPHTDKLLLASSLDARVRGHPGIKEHTDHKLRNALPRGLAEELEGEGQFILANSVRDFT